MEITQDDNRAQSRQRALFLHLQLSSSIMFILISLYLFFFRISSVLYCFFTDLQDWQAAQLSQTFPWSVCHLTQRPAQVNRRSALHIPTSAPTWSTTSARSTAAQLFLWSQRPEDWALQKVGLGNMAFDAYLDIFRPYQDTGYIPQYFALALKWYFDAYNQTITAILDMFWYFLCWLRFFFGSKPLK